MKKFFALMLAAMMLLSCTAAFAEGDVNMTNEISEAKNFDQKNSASDFSGADKATQSTDVWLQVEASGQIDVTIPLVAVFKTNIDGGKDTINESYEITNNSSANLAVTKVKITDEQSDITNNGDSTNMEMVESLTGGTTYDEYILNFFPEDHYVEGSIWTQAQNIADSVKSHDELNPTKFVKTGKTYTLSKDTFGGVDAEGKGLWLIERNQGTDGDNKSYVNMNLETSKLSFVTKQTAENKTNYGVKLFTVEYTVKIDNSEPVDTVIQGTKKGSTYTDRADLSDNEVTYTYNYTDITEE